MNTVGYEQEHADRMVWERLAALDAAGPRLEGEALRRMQELEERYKEWRRPLAPSPRDARRVLPSGEESDYSSTDLLALRPKHLADVLLTHERHRAGLQDAWTVAAKSRPRRALLILCQFLSRNLSPPGLTNPALDAIAQAKPRHHTRAGVLRLVEAIPDGELEQSIVELCRVLRAVSKDAPFAEHARLLAQWDRLLPVTRGHRPLQHDDRVLVATNHPAGVLAEALLLMLVAPKPARGSGLPQGLRERLDVLVEGRDEPSALARIILASRLHLLHFVDPTWTRQWVLPCLSWEGNPAAADCWAGYLWAPVLDDALFRDLKPHLLDALEHYSDIDRRWRDPLPVIVVDLSVDEEPRLTADEARRCLTAVDDHGRGEAAARLAHLLEDAGERAGNLWRNRIGPWLGRAWPRRKAARGSEASHNLIRASTAARDAFPEAMGTIRGFLVVPEHPEMVWHALKDSEVPKRHPLATLTLLDAVAPREISYKVLGLGHVLNAIAVADPAVRDDPRFKRLRDLSIGAGEPDLVDL